MVIRYNNLGGNFNGNEELVAGLMVECNRKNGGNRILVIKGIMNLYGKN
jgi:hypothetical protein